MNATEIAAALGGVRREGREYRCRCPLHDGRSLMVRDSDDGPLLHCFGGCDDRDVYTELRRLGLLGGRSKDQRAAPNHQVERRDRDQHDNAARTARALPIFQDALPISATPAERYLAQRGITLDDLPAEAQAKLRYNQHCPRPKSDDGTRPPPLPAMVAVVEHVERGPVAVHCTYILADGSGKAPVKSDKAMFGPVGGGAVWLALPKRDQWLCIAEGIETALSVLLATEIPAWAALSAGGIEALILPPESKLIVIAADNDTNGRGQHAAHIAAQRWLAEGRRVRIALPPAGLDFNDVLRSGAEVAEIGACHAAA